MTAAADSFGDATGFVGLSKAGTAVVSEVFAASTAQLGVDGARIFQSFAETGSFKTALGVSDGTIEALYGRAHQLFGIGQFQRAEEIFRTLCTLDPVRSDFWLGLGICYRIRGDYDSAMIAFDRATQLSPQDPIPHFHRLETFIRSEEWTRAQEARQLFEDNADGTEPATVIASFAKFKAALEMRDHPVDL